MFCSHHCSLICIHAGFMQRSSGHSPCIPPSLYPPPPWYPPPACMSNSYQNHVGPATSLPRTEHCQHTLVPDRWNRCCVSTPTLHAAFALVALTALVAATCTGDFIVKHIRQSSELTSQKACAAMSVCGHATGRRMGVLTSHAALSAKAASLKSAAWQHTKSSQTVSQLHRRTPAPQVPLMLQHCGCMLCRTSRLKRDSERSGAYRPRPLGSLREPPGLLDGDGGGASPLPHNLSRATQL